MANPYASSHDFQMWRRSVSRVEPHLIDPAVNAKFCVTKNMKVATAGSCFAQHIARKISGLGFNYFVPENGADLSADQRNERQFGVFSARYGNLYTVQQLGQLFREVFDGVQRSEQAWQRPDGRFVDPYRPMIEPKGYSSAAEVVADRHAHLAFVKDIFLNADVFVFTLGLTEAWRSKADGAVFPLAPGVVAGSYDEKQHEFHNFTVDETRAELDQFVNNLQRINPDVKILLTVSPVPLIATYEDRHVVASTTYSKSVLRVAAQEVCDKFSFVDYFPSYEIITNSATGGMYYEPDHREVNSIGVAHAMRCFMNAYTDFNAGHAVEPVQVAIEYASASNIVCDEEEIDRMNEQP